MSADNRMRYKWRRKLSKLGRGPFSPHSLAWKMPAYRSSRQPFFKTPALQWVLDMHRQVSKVFSSNLTPTLLSQRRKAGKLPRFSCQLLIASCQTNAACVHSIFADTCHLSFSAMMTAYRTINGVNETGREGQRIYCNRQCILTLESRKIRAQKGPRHLQHLALDPVS